MRARALFGEKRTFLYESTRKIPRRAVTETPERHQLGLGEPRPIRRHYSGSRMGGVRLDVDSLGRAT